MADQEKQLAETAIRPQSDLPSAKDEFGQKAHTKLADQIVSLVSSIEGGKSIGLLGTWGSGKSTIIELVRDKFSNEGENKFLTFLFDAWSHQNDPIHQSFLDEFITFLIRNKAIQKFQFKRQLKRLRGNKTEFVEESRTSLSVLGKFFAAVILFLPVGYLLVSPLAWNKAPLVSFTLPWLGPTQIYSPQVGLGIICLPIILTLLLYLAAKKSDKLKEQLEEHDIFSLLVNRSEKKTTTKTIQEGGPTSVELKKLFDTAVRSASQKNMKIVVVIDNLDRLPEDQIVDLWATIRNFFVTDPHSTRNSVLRTVWVIVPFSPAHISKAFAAHENKNSSADASESNLVGVDRPTTMTVGSQNSDFVQKTFDFTFVVPPPALSNWREFLFDKLDQSIGNSIGHEDKHSLYRILDIYFSNTDNNPTPRFIKHYVNSSMLLFRQWGEILDIRSIALYCLYGHKLEYEPSSVARVGFLDKQTEVSVADYEWSRELAAICFNMDLDSALEVVLEPVLRRHLEKGEAEKLEDYTSNKSFWLTVEKILTDTASDWASQQSEKLINAVVAISQCDLDNEPQALRVWQSISENFKNIYSFDEITSNFSEGITIILSKTPDRSIREVVGRLTSALSTLDQKTLDDPDSAQHWVEATTRLHRLLKERIGIDWQTNFNLHIGIPGDEAFFNDVLFCCSQSQDTNFSIYHRRTDAEKIVEQLATSLLTDSIADKDTSVVQEFVAHNTSYSPDPILTAVVQQLSSFKELKTSTSNKLIHVLDSLMFHQPNTRHKFAAKQQARILAQNGVLLWQFCRAIEQTDHDSQRVLFWILATSDSKLELLHDANSPHAEKMSLGRNYLTEFFSNPDSRPELLEALQKTSFEYLCVTDYLKMSKTDVGPAALWNNLASVRIKNNQVKRLNSTWVLENFSFLESALDPQTLENFASRFAGWESYVNEISEERSATSIDPQYFAYFASRDDNLGKHAKEWAHSCLTKLNTDDWTLALVNNSQELQLLLTLIDSGAPPLLRLDFKDALLSHVEAAVSSDPDDFLNDERFAKLPKVLRSDTRKVFYRNLSERVLTKHLSGPIVRRFISKFDPAISDNIPWQSHSEDLIEDVVCTLITEGHVDGLAWALENAGRINSALAGAPHLKALVEDSLSEASKRDNVDEETLNQLKRDLNVEI